MAFGAHFLFGGSLAKAGDEGDEGIWCEGHEERDEHKGEIGDTNTLHTHSGYSRGPESPTQI